MQGAGLKGGARKTGSLTLCGLESSQGGRIWPNHFDDECFKGKAQEA